MRTLESLPKAQHQFTVHYPGLWHDPYSGCAVALGLTDEEGDA